MEKNNTNSITIVIPNYNGAQILPKNLPHVLSVARKNNIQVIIVDDKSTDNSVELLKRDFPEIKLIEKEKNEGFSSTVNIGVKHSATPLVCLLNSDVLPSENFLEKLLPYFNDPLTAAVAMQDTSDEKDSRFGTLHGRGKFIFHRGFLLHWQMNDGDSSKLSSGITGWVSCGSGVFSKKIWDELGGLDELLNPFYFEDVDYGYRAWKSGYKMYFEASSQVDHVHKKGAIKSNYQEERIKTISYRNQVQFSWKNLTDPKLLFIHYLWLVRNVIGAIKNKDKAFLTGLLEAVKRRKEIKLKKQLLKKYWKITDSQILSLFN